MFTRPLTFVAALLMISALPSMAQTKTVCMIVAEASSGKVVTNEGNCDRRVTSASTFKLAIALMGYDSGFLIDAKTPELPFRKGYVDWRKQWRHAQTPESWMRESVVWYSQQITRHLGPERFKAYVEAFDYGNRDLSGDRGKDNGLTNAWLSSSLQISPREQIAFLRKLVNRQLPVSAKAYDMTAAISDYGMQPSGWHVHGKTGAGLPVRADGTKIRGKAYGWFVGWADKGDRTVVFARLIQDSERRDTPPSFRARDRTLYKTISSL